jgi:hypothetical protein
MPRRALRSIGSGSKVIVRIPENKRVDHLARQQASQFHHLLVTD